MPVTKQQFLARNRIKQVPPAEKERRWKQYLATIQTKQPYKKAVQRQNGAAKMQRNGPPKKKKGGRRAQRNGGGGRPNPSGNNRGRAQSAGSNPAPRALFRANLEHSQLGMPLVPLRAYTDPGGPRGRIGGSSTIRAWRTYDGRAHELVAFYQQAYSTPCTTDSTGILNSATFLQIKPNAAQFSSQAVYYNKFGVMRLVGVRLSYLPTQGSSSTGLISMYTDYTAPASPATLLVNALVVKDGNNTKEAWKRCHIDWFPQDSSYTGWIDTSGTPTNWKNSNNNPDCFFWNVEGAQASAMNLGYLFLNYFVEFTEKLV